MADPNGARHDFWIKRYVSTCYNAFPKRLFKPRDLIILIFILFIETYPDLS